MDLFILNHTEYEKKEIRDKIDFQSQTIKEVDDRLEKLELEKQSRDSSGTVDEAKDLELFSAQKEADRVDVYYK